MVGKSKSGFGFKSGFAYFCMKRIAKINEIECNKFKAMDDTGAIMTPFGDVVTVILILQSS